MICFICPCCAAEHTRGYLDGVRLFRCLRCGYQGYGFHPDPEIDKSLSDEMETDNEFARKHGLPEEHPFASWEPARSFIRHALGLL